MLSTIARRMLRFMLVLLCFIPWIGELYIPHLGNIVFMLMISVWIAMALIVFGISDGLNKIIKNTWIIIILGSLASTVLVPYLIYWFFCFYYNFNIANVVILPYVIFWSDSFLSTVLRIITLFVWITAFGLSLVETKIIDERFRHKEPLFVGLLPLVLFALFFPQSQMIVYICFAGYLFLAILWILRWDAKNAVTSLSLIGGIFTGVFLIIVMQDAFSTFSAWIYRNLSLTLSSITTWLSAKNSEAYNREIERLIKLKIKITPTPTPTPTPKPKKYIYNNPLWDAIQPYVYWTLMIIFVIAVIYFLYRNKNRFQILIKGHEKNKRAIVESIAAENHIAQQIAVKVKGVGKRLKSEIFASTREGKVRVMYRRIIQKMKQKAFPELSVKTPLEVMKLFPDCKEIIPIYNKVRYGEKKVSPDEYERAEKNFKQVMEELKLARYLKKKKDSEE